MEKTRGIKIPKPFECRSGSVRKLGRLNKALWLFYENVYPFLEGRAREQGNDLEGQLFPEVTAKGVVRRFPESSAGRFSQRFNKLTERFLDFTGIAPSMRGKFNPHHIRGLFADWIDKDIGLGTAATARAQGNDLSTTERSYLDANVSTIPAFTTKSKSVPRGTAGTAEYRPMKTPSPCHQRKKRYTRGRS